MHADKGGERVTTVTNIVRCVYVCARKREVCNCITIGILRGDGDIDKISGAVQNSICLVTRRVPRPLPLCIRHTHTHKVTTVYRLVTPDKQTINLRGRKGRRERYIGRLCHSERERERAFCFARACVHNTRRA